MKLLVLSDLHLDHRPAWNWPVQYPKFDAVIMAGDLFAPPTASIKMLIEKFPDHPVIFVGGNHEFYRYNIIEETEKGLRAAKRTNVHYLAPGVITNGGVRFIGATLWTDYALSGVVIANMQAAQYCMNDHRMISYPLTDKEVTRFLPKHALELHRRDLEFITAELAKPFEGKTVVVTHHTPHPKSVHPKYTDDPLNAAFTSDLSILIAETQPDLWVHGHTHSGFDYLVGKTRVVCNPKGYGPHRDGFRPENDIFDEKLIVEI